jgi:hypothetical protein
MCKGKFISIWIYGLILLLNGSARISAADQYPLWTKEPKTFLGLKLDEPLHGQIPECPADTMCYRTNKYGAILKNLPYLGIDNMFCIILVEGKGVNINKDLSAGVSINAEGNIDSISLTVGRRAGNQLVDLAHKKYGPPHEVETIGKGYLKKNDVYLYNNTGKKEHWYGEKIAIELEYADDDSVECDNIKGLKGTNEDKIYLIKHCEEREEAYLKAESINNIKRKEKEELNLQRRAIDNL